MSKDIKSNLKIINKLAKPKRDRLEPLKQLADVIQTHSKAKQLCESTSIKPHAMT